MIVNENHVFIVLIVVLVLTATYYNEKVVSKRINFSPEEGTVQKDCCPNLNTQDSGTKNIFLTIIFVLLAIIIFLGIRITMNSGSEKSHSKLEKHSLVKKLKTR